MSCYCERNGHEGRCDKAGRCLGPLVENKTQALMSPSSEPVCKCHERMGNDFWFLPMDKCLFSSGKCLDRAEFVDRSSIGEIIDGATAPKGPLDPFRGGALT